MHQRSGRRLAPWRAAAICLDGIIRVGLPMECMTWVEVLPDSRARSPYRSRGPSAISKASISSATFAMAPATISLGTEATRGSTFRPSVRAVRQQVRWARRCGYGGSPRRAGRPRERCRCSDEGGGEAVGQRGKVDVVKKLQAESKVVAMVGDGSSPGLFRRAGGIVALAVDARPWPPSRSTAQRAAPKAVAKVLPPSLDSSTGAVLHRGQQALPVHGRERGGLAGQLTGGRPGLTAVLAGRHWLRGR